VGEDQAELAASWAESDGTQSGWRFQALRVDEGRAALLKGGESPSGQSTGSSSSEPPKLTLRWESAMPVRTAELKVHDNDAPDVDESHYAIAVYGIPDRMIEGDLQKLGINCGTKRPSSATEKTT
jgi:hypothetical protein